LSRFALDESPFENSLPVGQLDHRELVNTFEQVIHASLRDGIQVASLADHDPFPLPGSNDREGYVTDSDIGFWISGLHDFLRVRHALQQTEFVPTNLLELVVPAVACCGILRANGPTSNCGLAISTTATCAGFWSICGETSVAFTCLSFRTCPSVTIRSI
jgi:hypothetical protein